MATKKRAGLGRGLSALIPQAPAADDRAIDVFFDGSAPKGRRTESIAIDASVAKEIPGQTEDSTESSRAAAKSKVSTEVEGDLTATATEPAPLPADAGPAVDETIAESRDDASGSVDPEVPSSAETATDADADPADLADADPADPADADPADDPIEGLLPIPGASLRILDPQRIVPNLRQPRQEFEQEALDELIVSVREFGVLQPIVVRPLPADDPRRGDGDYELIMGERRLRATKAAELDSIPAIVRETDDEHMLRDALLENLHRSQLNPLEEASAYRQLLDDFGCTQEELAQRIGRSRPRISNTLRLLNLPVDVQRRVAAGVLSAGHARAILSVGEPAGMLQLADKIVNEQLSVREAEAAAARMVNRVDRPEPRAEAPASDSLRGYLGEVGEHLGDRLNTRVKVILRKTKGQITIDFASVADLRRILGELGEEVAE